MFFEQEQDSTSVNLDRHDDPHLERQIDRLFQLQIRRRWWGILILWLTLGLFCLWLLRSDIALWLEHFTWAAVRISIRYNRPAFIGLGLCVGITLSTLLRQSAYILNLSEGLHQELVKEVSEIRRRGPKHPLWQKVCALNDDSAEPVTDITIDLSDPDQASTDSDRQSSHEAQNESDMK
ncbi:hypothetical protein Pse7367_2873 [Thalassoporum mexicanum PCC 7367]|uniref:hypothetical protein n=1 Tax=Thalassoporum mexicanum TaxID=3457544 RepID=UPI00029FEBEC|nr:hypothetical protein [Pseudanabaena sp. PCC 7367]AFY71126.1 hypothetical protein Pse7367_2873 [Pseudanabaena sp. PCC 7367]